MQIKDGMRFKPFTHQAGAKVLLPGTKEEFQCFPEGIEGFTLLLDLDKGSIVKFGNRFREVIENSRSISLERLTLGVNKKQEWEGIYKRCNVEEFLPLWYQMAQWYETNEEAPAGSLLQSCFEEKDKIELTKKLQNLFTAGFSNLFYPQSTDLLRHGFPQEPLGASADPTLLFSLGKKLIRSFFFKALKNELHFLPLVPKGIHCGRFINIQEENLTIDLEWTKHLPRRVVIQVQKETKLTFCFPKEIDNFRVKNLNQRFENGVSLDLSSGRYCLDQFKK